MPCVSTIGDALVSGDEVVVGGLVGDRRGRWPAEVVALTAFPSLGPQDVGLHLSFDALRDTAPGACR